MKNKEVQFSNVRIYIDGKEVEGVKCDFPVFTAGPNDKVYRLQQKPTKDYFPEIWVNEVAKEIKRRSKAKGC